MSHNTKRRSGLLAHDFVLNLSLDTASSEKLTVSTSCQKRLFPGCVCRQHGSWCATPISNHECYYSLHRQQYSSYYEEETFMTVQLERILPRSYAVYPVPSIFPDCIAMEYIIAFITEVAFSFVVGFLPGEYNVPTLPAGPKGDHFLPLDVASFLFAAGANAFPGLATSHSVGPQLCCHYLVRFP